MIPRREARRFLAGYIDKAAELLAPEAVELIYPHALGAVADVFVEESDDVLRGAENKEQKGRRYLTEGRITVREIRDTGVIVAECRGGSGELYTLGYDPKRKQWRCTCIAKGKFSHVVALQLVVATPKPTGG